MNYPHQPDTGKRTKTVEEKRTVPPQHQNRQPGCENDMQPQPIFENHEYRPTKKLKNKTVLITGGDSGIGRAIAVLFAKEGADLAVVYLDEHDDAKKTQKRIEEIGQKCRLLAGDIKDEAFCLSAVKDCAHTFGKIDILINNAAQQY